MGASNPGLQAQLAISQQLGVRGAFEPAREVAARTDFLADYLAKSGRRSFVLGISGGVDSLVAGCLARRAVQQVRQGGQPAQLIAVRLPYGRQADEADAQKCLGLVQADISLEVNIQPAADGMRRALLDAGLSLGETPAEEDFLMGNIKARERMVAQYAIAGAHDGLVLGTGNAAEALMGFFTKFGDGAADVSVLAGLTKRRVRALAQQMGAPAELVFKVPTADLESLRPQRPDEDALGLSYEDIDNFLEGNITHAEAVELMTAAFHRTAHKRALPVRLSQPEP